MVSKGVMEESMVRGRAMIGLTRKKSSCGVSRQWRLVRVLGVLDGQRSFAYSIASSPIDPP